MPDHVCAKRGKHATCTHKGSQQGDEDVSTPTADVQPLARVPRLLHSAPPADTACTAPEPRRKDSILPTGDPGAGCRWPCACNQAGRIKSSDDEVAGKRAA